MGHFTSSGPVESWSQFLSDKINDIREKYKCGELSMFLFVYFKK